MLSFGVIMHCVSKDTICLSAQKWCLAGQIHDMLKSTSPPTPEGTHPAIPTLSSCTQLTPPTSASDTWAWHTEKPGCPLESVEEPCSVYSWLFINKTSHSRHLPWFSSLGNSVINSSVLAAVTFSGFPAVLSAKWLQRSASWSLSRSPTQAFLSPQTKLLELPQNCSPCFHQSYHVLLTGFIACLLPKKLVTFRPNYSV